MQIESAFDEDGQPLIMGDLINGNGIVYVYNRDGKIRSYGAYSNGLKNGYWKIVSNAGVADSVEFVDGLRLSTGRYEFVP
jgi:antitoxin component YwqK of YwqJK toxin-antitoxin module